MDTRPSILSVGLVIALTLITGAECTALILHGVSMAQDPEMLRDGQYVFVFFMGGGVGALVAIPSAVLGAALLMRSPGFVRSLGVALALLTALGIGLGLLLSASAGANAVVWGALGVGLTFIGVLTAPFGLLGFAHIAPVAVPVGVVMLLAIGGAYWLYRRRV